MRKLILLTTTLVCLSTCLMIAQEPLLIDTSRRSLYSGVYFGEELYRFAGDETIEQMAAAICTAAGQKQNFQVINANVPNVAAVVDGKSRYLLYNRRYFYDNGPNRTLLYAILAHEIGHLLFQHQLDGKFRIREETLADEFMGQTLMRLDSSAATETVLRIIRQEPFSYTEVPWEEREKAIRSGLERSAALLEGPGFGVNETNLESLPLPRFQIHGCPERISLNRNRFARCHNFQDVDVKICQALDAKGYHQRSYYCIKNGFALVTGIEQFNSSGTSVTGEARWQDYPKRNSFDGILDYLSSLVFPQTGRYRAFVFIINDLATMEYETGCLEPEGAKDWLRKGGDWLPDELAKKPFNTAQFRVRVLLYEFKVPGSTMKLGEECDNRLTALKHLQQSGILGELRP